MNGLQATAEDEVRALNRQASPGVASVCGARPRGRCHERQIEARSLRRIMRAEFHDAALRIDAEYRGVLRKCTATIVIAPGEVQHIESVCAQALLVRANQTAVGVAVRRPHSQRYSNVQIPLSA